MRFVVEFVNQSTGERRDIVVDLTPQQQADVTRQRTGGPHHPLANRYALDNAEAKAPRGFVSFFATGKGLGIQLVQ
jgi:hypothetical protein